MVDHFTKFGKPVFAAAMDMSKAFDMVKWSELFNTLLSRGVRPIFLRLLLFIYRHQQCNVKWGDEVSALFDVSNGVRQGGVISGIFFVVYIDELLCILRKSGFGCTIHGVFVGAFIYADDIFLLSCSRTGLQEMVNLCNNFVVRLNLKFGTNSIPSKSKTKCIIFNKKKNNNVHVKKILLDGNELPWVSEVKHLGHTLQENNSMSLDISSKRGYFIGKVNSLIQEFHYAAPEVLLRLVQAYACNVYGSNTWDLFSSDCQRLFRSFNVAVRTIFNLPRTTHRYIVESLIDSSHLYVQLLSRYVTFSKSLLENDAFEVRFLAQCCISDKRSILAKSLYRIADETKFSGHITDLSASYVKKKLRYASIPDTEKWRIDVIQEMCNILQKRSSDNHLTDQEATQILEYACTS